MKKLKPFLYSFEISETFFSFCRIKNENFSTFEEKIETLLASCQNESLQFSLHS